MNILYYGLGKSEFDRIIFYKDVGWLLILSLIRIYFDT